jgi:hypothetical protein
MNCFTALASSALCCATFPSSGLAQESHAEGNRFTPATLPGVVAYAEHINGDGEVIIHRTIEVESPDEPGKKIRIGQVLKKLQDGYLLFVPGQQPEEANAYRQTLCQKTGSKDATNQSYVIISAETLDGGACKQSHVVASPGWDANPSLRKSN